MKSRTLMWIAALTLFAALAVPVRLAAQHTRYKLIDFGPSGIGIPGRPSNNRGTVVFGACGDPDCAVGVSRVPTRMFLSLMRSRQVAPLFKAAVTVSRIPH
jgi:hypothetical protein